MWERGAPTAHAQRLDDVGVGALPDAALHHLLLVVGRDHDDGDVGPVAATDLHQHLGGDGHGRSLSGQR